MMGCTGARSSDRIGRVSVRDLKIQSLLGLVQLGTHSLKLSTSCDIRALGAKMLDWFRTSGPVNTSYNVDVKPSGTTLRTHLFLQTVNFTVEPQNVPIQFLACGSILKQRFMLDLTEFRLVIR